MFKLSDLFQTGLEEGVKIIGKLLSCFEEVRKFSGLRAKIEKKNCVLSCKDPAECKDNTNVGHKRKKKKTKWSLSFLP